MNFTMHNFPYTLSYGKRGSYKRIHLATMNQVREDIFYKKLSHNSLLRHNLKILKRKKIHFQKETMEPPQKKSTEACFWVIGQKKTFHWTLLFYDIFNNVLSKP